MRKRILPSNRCCITSWTRILADRSRIISLRSKRWRTKGKRCGRNDEQGGAGARSGVQAIAGVGEIRWRLFGSLVWQSDHPGGECWSGAEFREDGEGVGG